MEDSQQRKRSFQRTCCVTWPCRSRVARSIQLQTFRRGRQNRLHANVYRLRVGALLWRVAPVEVVDKAHCLTATRDVRLGPIDCLPLRHSVVRHESLRASARQLGGRRGHWSYLNQSPQPRILRSSTELEQLRSNSQFVRRNSQLVNRLSGPNYFVSAFADASDSAPPPPGTPIAPAPAITGGHPVFALAETTALHTGMAPPPLLPLSTAEDASASVVASSQGPLRAGFFQFGPSTGSAHDDFGVNVSMADSVHSYQFNSAGFGVPTGGCHFEVFLYTLTLAFALGAEFRVSIFGRHCRCGQRMYSKPNATSVAAF